MASPFDLPFELPLGGPAAPLPPGEEIPDAFGTDVFFDGNTHVTASGDLLELSGRENLRRSIIRRLITNPGEYRLNPTYGVGVLTFVKKPITQSNIDRLEQRIRDQLPQDPRIEQVLEISITSVFFGSVPGIKIAITVQASGRSLRFQPFQFQREV